jgi:CHAD domain-containing protein
VRHIDHAISRNLAILFSTLSGIRDGQSDAIHDARVATRRLRAALPLAWADSPNSIWMSGYDIIRRLGKHLGKVREVDVALEQLPSLEARVPTAAPSLAAVRLQLGRRQAKQRRRLVKDVERLSLEELHTERLVPVRTLSLRVDRRWRAVEGAIIEHAAQLIEAVDAASGVYFPNRSHRVRVETKKLRYVLELVGNTESASLVKHLRRAQEILGQLHDHHVLKQVLRSADGLDKDHRQVLVGSIDATCDELFREYLTRRSQLVDVSREARAAAKHGAWRPLTVAGMLLTAGAMAVPSVVLRMAAPPLPRRVPPARLGATSGVTEAAGIERNETAVEGGLVVPKPA